MKQYKKTNAINFLVTFAKGDDEWKDLYMTPSNNSIIRCDKWNKLDRVWNEGHGRLVVAEKNETQVFYNSMLLSFKEISEIKKQVTDKEILFVELGYPKYYQHGLISLYEKEGKNCLYPQKN
jgi:hypothetical protein